MENIVINNKDLENQIHFNLNTILGTPITDEDLLKITELSLDSISLNGGMNPVYVEELKYFKNLERLSLKNLKISKDDFTYICSLHKLEVLSFDSCNLETLDGISQLNNLDTIEFYNTFAKNFSPIRELKKLKRISLVNLLITDIRFLEDLKELKELNIPNLRSLDNSILSNLTQLEKINVSGINNLNFNFISNLPKLNHIGLSASQIESNKDFVESLLAKKIAVFSNNLYQITNI